MALTLWALVRRRRTLLTLGAITGVGFATAIFTMASVRGIVWSYLSWWTWVLGALWVVGIPAIWPDEPIVPFLVSGVGILVVIGVALLLALWRGASVLDESVRPTERRRIDTVGGQKANSSMPPISGVASTMMSPPKASSASWRMPSLFMSTADTSVLSTVLQRAIHSGRRSKGALTSTV